MEDMQTQINKKLNFREEIEEKKSKHMSNMKSKHIPDRPYGYIFEY